MDDGVKMISSATKAFELRLKSGMSHEEVLIQISKMASVERDQKVKIGMIAAASKALSIIDQNPSYNERQVIGEVMKELPSIIETANEDVRFYSSE